MAEKAGGANRAGCCSLFAHSDAAARLAVVSRCGGSVFSVRFQSAGLGQWSHIGGRCKLRLLGISEIVRTGLGQPSYTGGFGKRGMLAWKQLGARWLVLRLLDPMGTSVLLVRFDVVQRGRASCAQTARCACACTGPCTTRATLRRDCSAQGRNLDVHLTSKRLRWGRIFPTMNWSGTSGTDDQGMDVYWTSLWTSIGRPYVDVHEALKTGISALPRPAGKAANEPFPKSSSGRANVAPTW